MDYTFIINYFKKLLLIRKYKTLLEAWNLKIPEFYRVCVFSSNQQQRHPTIPE